MTGDSRLEPAQEDPALVSSDHMTDGGGHAPGPVNGGPAVRCRAAGGGRSPALRCIVRRRWVVVVEVRRS